MPNIIEQQDLLKGLPDDRLSMLMQNPTGDIPPFLVAAEAQRRQSIREQFSGGPQESVVDTLTKQLSNVPQNIQAPAQTPPQMPPPQMQPPQQPEMGGVAALQQGIRDGGMVRRYAPGGIVAPLPTRVQDIADQFGVSVDQAAEMLKNNPSLAGGAATPGLPFQINEQNQSPAATPLELNLPSVTISPAELLNVRKEAAREAKYQEMDSYPGYGSATSPTREAIRTSPNSSMGMSFTAPVKTASPTNIPPDPNAGKQDTSIQNQMSVEEYRKRREQIGAINAEDSAFIKQKLEELYGGEGLSDWERAQKWFAAAKAAIEPGQTNMQSVVNALSALSGGYAEERSAEREDQRALQEALLKQEIADRQAASQSKSAIEEDVLKYQMTLEDRARATAAASAEIDRDYMKWRSGEGLKEAQMQGQRVSDIKTEIASRMKLLGVGTGVTEEEAMKDPVIASLMKELNEIRKAQSDAMTESLFAREGYGKLVGMPFDYETADGVSPITRSR